MPQLMPLMWVFSSMMVFLLLLVFVNLFFLSLNYYLDLSLTLVFEKNYKMEW